MIYKEEKRDLFSVPHDYALCHCISSDFKMGAGIAIKFSELGIKKFLCERYSIDNWNDIGYCLCAFDNKFPWDVCFNLVTKKYYWQKPTLKTLKNALENMRDKILSSYCMSNKIAMPKIGCGLDSLKWEDVSKIIQDVFYDTDIEILVCYM